LASFNTISQKYQYRRAAVLLLGKDEAISRFIPGYKLDIFIKKENLDRWDDRKTFITNLIDTIIGALDFIKGYLPEVFYDDGLQRIDLRDRIFRELISNVIVHREYTNALPTSIIVTKDEIKATNPNIIHNRGTLDPIHFEHYPKNPYILKFFDDLGWSEEAGTGVRNISKFLKIYSPGSVPTFKEDNPFITNIPVNTYTLGVWALILLDFLGVDKDMFDTNRIKLVQELKIDRRLSESKEENEFIGKLAGTFVKNEGKLSGFKILKKNVLINEPFKMGGTLSEKGGNLILKKSRKLIMVLIGLVKEMTLDETTNFAGFSDRETFREDYLNILRKDGLIDLTNPDKINDPNQKYTITEKGKKLIGGFEII
jgi:ATP-dependent DNA helicase RecG